MKLVVLAILRAYKKTHFVRSSIGRLFFLPGSDCIYRPTCSEYMYEAVEKYGVVKGGGMGVRRILRCRPGKKGGYDPVS